MASHALGQDTPVGQTLGHYRMVEKIGAGGMGEVYRARDEHLDRDVAIKVLPPQTFADESARKHFRKEALALSKLNHPNIATIHDFDTQHGVDFLVMEYISGITLSEKLSGRPLLEKEVVALGTPLAEGLAAAHEHGVVHRDLKPGNLRLTPEGRLKILDFGLAKLRLPVTATAATESFSETKSIAGTLPYMAPEQLLGGEIDARTDIHATGAVLYEMATGQRPFADSESSQLIGAILHKPPAPPNTINPRLSTELQRIITKCLEKEPENRYQSAKELAVDLRRLARDSDSARITFSPSPAPRLNFITRNKALLATAAVMGIFLLAAAFWLMHPKKVTDDGHIPASIAVLPFTDLSPEKDQEYFSDGLAEELLNSLAKIPQLHVAARTSAFQFKGKNEDLRVIGQKLNVATVLEGSVRKQGQRVRITAQLIQVSDGYHLWSEAYDRDLTDIFAVQEDIANAVAGSLKVTLLGQKAPSARSTNVDAYNAYLQGKYFEARMNKENLEKAMSYYQQAVKLDPNYAPGWAGLSRTHNFQDTYGDEAFGLAREEAKRAIALDPNLADGYAALGSVKFYYDWDWKAADASYQRALALEPGNPAVLEDAAELAAMRKQFDQALQWNRKAVELDPLRASAYHELAYNAWWAGHLDESMAASQKLLEVNPQFPWLYTVLTRVCLAQSRPQEALAAAERETVPAFRLEGLALAYHALGRTQESDQSLSELMAQYSSVSAFQVAEVYAFRGELDSAFQWLDKSYRQRDTGMFMFPGDPLFANLERDPRYAAFVKKLNFQM